MEKSHARGLEIMLSKISMPSRVVNMIYIFDAIPVNLLMIFLTEIEKYSPKIKWNHKKKKIPSNPE
jgi:hypothetical protein